MFELPKVSFIVISHNFEDFIEDCLNSIKNQTYKNFEVVVVDDYSSDNTCQLINKFIENNKENLDIKFIANTENIGQLNSFLKGLKQVTGQFVCSIDGDDVLFPDYTAIHVETHLQTSVAMTTCQQIEIDKDNVIHSLFSVDSPYKNIKSFDVEFKTLEDFEKYRYGEGIIKEGSNVKILDNSKYSFASWHWSPTSSAMIRKSVCDMLLLLDKSKKIKITADKFIFSFAHLIGSSAIIYKPLYAYRRHLSNYSQANPVMGSRKYHRVRTQKNYLRNNKRIRRQIFDFIYVNRKYFAEKLNRTNLLLLFKRIIFSFDRNSIKGFFKSLFV